MTYKLIVAIIGLCLSVTVSFAADTTISALPELTEAAPNDVLVIDDVSAPATKKITVQNFLSGVSGHTGVTPYGSDGSVGTPNSENLEFQPGTSGVSTTATGGKVYIGVTESDPVYKARTDIVVDGAFGVGILKRTGVSTYGTVTDNSTTWDLATTGATQAVQPKLNELDALSAVSTYLKPTSIGIAFLNAYSGDSVYVVCPERFILTGASLYVTNGTTGVAGVSIAVGSSIGTIPTSFTGSQKLLDISGVTQGNKSGTTTIQAGYYLNFQIAQAPSGASTWTVQLFGNKW